MDRNEVKNNNTPMNHNHTISKIKSKIRALFKASLIKLLDFKGFGFVAQRLGLPLSSITSPP